MAKPTSVAEQSESAFPPAENRGAGSAAKGRLALGGALLLFVLLIFLVVYPFIAQLPIRVPAVLSWRILSVLAIGAGLLVVGCAFSLAGTKKRRATAVCFLFGGLCASAAAAMTGMNIWDVSVPDSPIAVRQEGVTGRTTARYVFLADSGAGSPQLYKLIQLIMVDHRERPIDGIFLLGDNVYRNDVGTGEEAVRRAIHLPMAPFIEAGIPLYALLGNHDYDDDPVFAQAQLADPLLNMNGRTHYEVWQEGSPIQFYLLDSERLSHDVDQEHSFRQAFLKSDAPWKIALIHKPLVGSDVDGDALLHSLLSRSRAQSLGIDLIISGDIHHYELHETDFGFAQLIVGGSSDVADDEIAPEGGIRAWYTKDEFYTLIDFSMESATVRVTSHEQVLVDEFIYHQDRRIEVTERGTSGVALRNDVSYPLARVSADR